MSTLSWQASAAAGGYITGGMILGLIGLNFPGSSESGWTIRWQQTLVAIAAIIIIGLMNIYGSRLLPYFQEVLMVLHVAAWITTIAIFSVRAPHVSATEAFAANGFENNGGWSSMGLTLMVGQISAVYALVSRISPVHRQHPQGLH
jgi:choline transport protein